MLRVRKGDEVVVVAGKEKGKRGRVLRVDPEKLRIWIEKVNLVKRHQKPSQQFPQGGILEKEAPMNLSNVMLVDPKDGKPTRVRMQILDNGSKVRVASRSGEQIGAPIGRAQA